MNGLPIFLRLRIVTLLLLVIAAQGCRSPSASSSGFVSSLKGQLLFEDLSSKQDTWKALDFSSGRMTVEPVAPPPDAKYQSAKLSPNGTMSASQIGDTVEGQWVSKGIQVTDTLTGRLVFEITEPSARDPSWSPDSTRLAFVAHLESGEYSGATITGMYSDVFYVDFNSETRTIVNVTQTSRFSKIPAALTELGGIMVWEPTWSLDGTAIASVWNRYNDETIWVSSTDGKEWARLISGSRGQYLLVKWIP
jgi:hypothetical protein